MSQLANQTVWTLTNSDQQLSRTWMLSGFLTVLTAPFQCRDVGSDQGLSEEETHRGGEGDDERTERPGRKSGSICGESLKSPSKSRTDSPASEPSRRKPSSLDVRWIPTCWTIHPAMAIPAFTDSLFHPNLFGFIYQSDSPPARPHPAKHLVVHTAVKQPEQPPIPPQASMETTPPTSEI